MYSSHPRTQTKMAVPYLPHKRAQRNQVEIEREKNGTGRRICAGKRHRSMTENIWLQETMPVASETQSIAAKGVMRRLSRAASALSEARTPVMRKIPVYVLEMVITAAVRAMDKTPPPCSSTSISGWSEA